MIEIELNTHLRAEIIEVDNRVYPNLMPQNCQKPAIVYSVISSIESAYQGGWCDGSHDHEIRMQVDIYSASYAEKKEIKDRVIEALKSFKYPIYSIVNRDVFEQKTELFRELIEFKI